MTRKSIFIICLMFLVSFTAFAAEEAAEPNASELAKQTQNPVAELISIPFQFNLNSGGDLGDGTFFNLNFQPSIPFKLNPSWNMIVRTIVPVLSIPGPEGTRFSGIGDMQEQIFFAEDAVSEPMSALQLFRSVTIFKIV